jgi:hypothetical protein
MNKLLVTSVALIQRDVLPDITHIPRLPAPGKQELDCRRVGWIVEEMRIFDGRITHQAKVHLYP